MDANIRRIVLSEVCAARGLRAAMRRRAATCRNNSLGTIWDTYAAGQQQTIAALRHVLAELRALEHRQAAEDLASGELIELRLAGIGPEPVEQYRDWTEPELREAWGL